MEKIFNNIEAAKKSELYKNLKFHRFYKDQNTGKFVFETEDFGHILSHQTLLKLGQFQTGKLKKNNHIKTKTHEY